MASTLIDVWRNQPDFFPGKSFRQIIQFADDGRLRDGSQACTQLRSWLSAIPLDMLRNCVEQCLSQPFDESGHALQDAANEVGRRLGFDVTPGRYRGVRGEIGNDGLWVAQDGFGLLVEVKTTDAYRINLNTIANYRDGQIAAGKLDREMSSILIAVGRQETGDLEAQIRGSQHAWTIRLISLDALLRLAEVKEELNDESTSNQINQLLRPVEYTRLDGIVELLFATKRDIETTEEITPPLDVSAESSETPLPKAEFRQARETAIQRISEKLGCKFIRTSVALRISSDKTTRLVCLSSRRYDKDRGPGVLRYWFGFTPAQRDFLKEATNGWVAFVFADSGRTFLIPREQFFSWLPEFSTTPSEPASPDELRHWHIYLTDHGSRIEMSRIGRGDVGDLAQYDLANELSRTRPST